MSKEHNFKNIHKFELGVLYTFRGRTFKFVRRTPKCIFDDKGQKYTVGVNQTDERWETGVEFVKPLGQYMGHLFARRDS